VFSETFVLAFPCGRIQAKEFKHEYKCDLLKVRKGDTKGGWGSASEACGRESVLFFFMCF
jgi:hypothetical protein